MSKKNNFSKKPHPALHFLHTIDAIARKNNLWQLAATFYAMKNKEMAWPDYVFLPFAAWYAAACTYLHKERLQDPLHDIPVMHKFAIAGTWRMTQDIVRFDQDLYTSLRNTPLEGEISLAIVRQLPSWCVYVETPNLFIGFDKEKEQVFGFWAMLEFDVNTKGEELRIFFLGKNQTIYSIFLVLDEKLTIYEAIKKIQEQDIVRGLYGSEYGKELARQSLTYAKEAINVAVNLLLFLCAYGYSEGVQGTSGTQAQKKRQAKGTFQSFAASRPSFHSVGKKLGDALRDERRRARKEEKSKSKTQVEGERIRKPIKPHIRTAHWHGFWRKKEGVEDEKEFFLKWLPPIPVAMNNVD